MSLTKNRLSTGGPSIKETSTTVAPLDKVRTLSSFGLMKDKERSIDIITRYRTVVDTITVYPYNLQLCMLCCT
jgi:hypothetical protein